MRFTFSKYQGTGNDFIMLHDAARQFPDHDAVTIARLCHRRFGIGADGLILLRPAEGYDFTMDYFNSDGRRSSMCGNGGRCITAFAAQHGIIRDHARFLAVDGPHEAWIEPQGVRLRMTLPHDFRDLGAHAYFLHTGSPHYVRFETRDIHSLDMKAEGRAVRYSEPWQEQGVNVNLVNFTPDGSLQVRTYERGVEDETYSCGTGVTAVAEVWKRLHPEVKDTLTLHTPGGTLHVHTRQGLEPDLIGPALRVFDGEFSL